MDKTDRAGQGAQGQQGGGLEALQAIDPATFRAAGSFEAAVLATSALDAATTALVRLAVDVSVSRLNVPGVQRHIAAALDAGATPTDVMEVCMLSSVLGVHSMTLGFPILREELEAVGRGGELDRELDDHASAVKARFMADRGFWTPRWQQLLEGAPAFFEAYAAFSSHPWLHGTLAPKVKEFIYIAIDASTNHLHALGVRSHIRNALGHGATPQEIVSVLALASLVGLDSCALGASVLQALRGAP